MKAKRKNDEIRRYRPDRVSALFHGLFGLVWVFGGFLFLISSVMLLLFDVGSYLFEWVNDGILFLISLVMIPIFAVGGYHYLITSLRIFRYSYRLNCKTYLLVTPSHLHFGNSSYTGIVAWEQIIGITRIHYRIHNHQTSENLHGYTYDWLGDGFLLDEKQSFQSVEDVPPILTHSIPIGDCVSIPRHYWGFGAMDWDKFAQTDFGRDLLRYAPHLFEGKLSEKAKVG